MRAMETACKNENVYSYKKLPCAATTIVAHGKPHKISTFFQYNIIPNNILAAKQAGGSSTKEQEADLKNFIHSNTINYRNRAPDYLFKISEQYFPDFISPSPWGRNATIQRM
jgi:hypothetical protein